MEVEIVVVKIKRGDLTGPMLIYSAGPEPRLAHYARTSRVMQALGNDEQARFEACWNGVSWEVGRRFGDLAH